MSIHIGSTIHSLIKAKKLKATYVADEIHMSKSTLYKLYKAETVDINVLVKLSELLNTNLFLPYFEKEPFNQMFCQEVGKLNKEIITYQGQILNKDDKIKNLEEIITYQKRLLELLEEKLTNGHE